MHRPSRFFALAAALALGAASLPALPTYAQAANAAIWASRASRKRGLLNQWGFPLLMGNKATGDTVARAKRRAKKRRNQLRHKRAVRR